MEPSSRLQTKKREAEAKSVLVTTNIVIAEQLTSLISKRGRVKSAFSVSKRSENTCPVLHKAEPCSVLVTTKGDLIKRNSIANGKQPCGQFLLDANTFDLNSILSDLSRKNSRRTSETCGDFVFRSGSYEI